MRTGWVTGYFRPFSRNGQYGWLLLLLLLLLNVHVTQAHAGSKLIGFRMVQQQNVMLHFDLDAAQTRVEMFALEKPNRLVIDLPGVALATSMPDKSYPAGVVRAVRSAQHGDQYLRVVLDLRAPVSPSYRFVSRQSGQRLVVDLGVASEAGVAGGEVAMATIAQRTPEPERLRDTVVAIDAGHGGRDPGAIGQRKTHEKDITLAVARKLAERLQSRQGVRPVLTRDEDVYVDLSERVGIARRNGADLFISIHADAINHNDASGSSVYALSLKGASSEAAAWLARSDNESAALYGDVDLGELEGGLRRTILSLTQGATMEQSMEAGADVLSELKKIGKVHKAQVEQAAFVVLKAPDIPSILVETAFLSNLQEERKLNDPGFQDDLSAAIEAGVMRYLERRAPADTLLAAQRRQRGS